MLIISRLQNLRKQSLRAESSCCAYLKDWRENTILFSVDHIASKLFTTPHMITLYNHETYLHPHLSFQTSRGHETTVESKEFILDSVPYNRGLFLLAHWT